MTSFGAKCPHCESLFKVYPDQLRLFNGFANCGACGLTFDVISALMLLPTEYQARFIPLSEQQTDRLPTLNAVVEFTTHNMVN